MSDMHGGHWFPPADDRGQYDWNPGGSEGQRADITDHAHRPIGELSQGESPPPGGWLAGPDQTAIPLGAMPMKGPPPGMSGSSGPSLGGSSGPSTAVKLLLLLA